MSFTNQTTNYGLPQWIGTDKPTYLVDQNGAYAIIDTELYNANSNATTALSSAASAVEVAGTASTNAQTAIDSAATANTNANSAIVTANTAITDAANALSRVQAVETDINNMEVLIDTHTYTTATGYGTVLDTVGTAIASAISDYPFEDYQYAVIINDGTNIRKIILENEISGDMHAIQVSTSSIDIVYNVKISGSGSGVYQRSYLTTGTTVTDITSTTVSANTTVNVKALKL